MLCLLLVGRKKERKEKKRNVQGAFFPRAGHTSLAVPQGIFVALRCN
jgi:hypothetical protein